jgi:hypothetical protein
MNLEFEKKAARTGIFKRFERKHGPKLRSSTKALAAGAGALALTASPLAERFHSINDWDSLIVLVITWLVSRLTKTPSEPGRL